MDKARHPQTYFYRVHVICGMNMSARPDPEILDQYVMALVAMEHAEPELMPDTSVRGKTWLQKMMWFASEHLGRDRMGFVAGKYGAYSAEIDDAVERCAEKGLLCVHRAERESVIHITKKGVDALDLAVCDQYVLRHMQSIKSLLNGLSYREMIAYSYALSPEMAENSKISDRFEEWRVDAAVSMYLKGAASLALAGRISGLDREAFYEHLRRGGIEAPAPLVRTRVVAPRDVPKIPTVR